MCGLARGQVYGNECRVIISDVMGFRVRASTGEAGDPSTCAA